VLTGTIAVYSDFLQHQRCRSESISANTSLENISTTTEDEQSPIQANNNKKPNRLNHNNNTTTRKSGKNKTAKVRKVA
jgi:hypothetical protein